MSLTPERTRSLRRQIAHYATFPQTGVSLRQMVMFGTSWLPRRREPGLANSGSSRLYRRRPESVAGGLRETEHIVFQSHIDLSTPQGTLLRASQFLAAELPIRLAHRVKELDELPQGLHKMPSIEKVKRWYAQSFEVRLKSLLRF